MSEEKEALRKLIMLISDLRAKDEERYSSHVNFMKIFSGFPKSRK